MIASLKGTVITTIKRTIILNVNGVGYLINAPSQFLKRIKTDEELMLYISTQVREDAITLYGFPTLIERTFFEKLITVNGIGPKIAMDMMEISVEKISSAIFREDVANLMSIPGIGKKTAERIVLELKGKIEPPESLERIPGGLGKHNIPQDAIYALTNLGYSKSHVFRVLDDMPEQIKDVEAIVKYFLQHA